VARCQSPTKRQLARNNALRKALSAWEDAHPTLAGQTAETPQTGRGSSGNRSGSITFFVSIFSLREKVLEERLAVARALFYIARKEKKKSSFFLSYQHPSCEIASEIALVKGLACLLPLLPSISGERDIYTSGQEGSFFHK
jgi:hypothetical protein